jgi:hypothetical protein
MKLNVMIRDAEKSVQVKKQLSSFARASQFKTIS